MKSDTEVIGQFDPQHADEQDAQQCGKVDETLKETFLFSVDLFGGGAAC